MQQCCYISVLQLFDAGLQLMHMKEINHLSLMYCSVGKWVFITNVIVFIIFSICEFK